MKPGLEIPNAGVPEIWSEEMELYNAAPGGVRMSKQNEEA